MNDFGHFLSDVSRESCHNHGVMISWCRQTNHSNVRVSNSLNLEDTALLGNNVKGEVQTLQQSKHVYRLPSRAPSLWEQAQWQNCEAL
jgi:hypothetical protein